MTNLVIGEKRGGHGHEGAKRDHQYHDEGDMHVDLRHVYNLLRSSFRCTLPPGSKPLCCLTLAEGQSQETRRQKHTKII